MLSRNNNQNTAPVEQTRPYVTAIMTCYNDKAFVEQALTSLLQQTRPPDRIIVLDDASTDGSFELLEWYDAAEKTVQIARNAHNLGTTKTRNKLVSLIPDETTYVAILDSDDVALPTRLEQQLAYLQERPFLTACNSAVEIINQAGEVIGEKSHTIAGDMRRYATCWNPFVQSAMLIRWKDWQTVGDYDETLARGEDYDMWLRMLAAGCLIDILPEPLVQFRVHESQGKWKKSQLSMRSYAGVRARYLFKPGFFSLKALLITAGYFIASLIPGRIMVWLYTHFYVRKAK